jgi:competence protein ComEC
VVGLIPEFSFDIFLVKELEESSNFTTFIIAYIQPASKSSKQGECKVVERCFVQRLTLYSISDKTRNHFKLDNRPKLPMAPILVIICGWLTGLFLQGWLNFPAENLTTAAGLSGLLAGGGWLYSRWKNPQSSGLNIPLIGLVVLAGCLGGLRLEWAEPPTGPDGLLYYQGQPGLTLTGVVSAEPLYSGRSGSFRLEAREIRVAGSANLLPVSGQVYVRTGASVAVEQGDLLRLTGTLAQPQEISGDDFPYRDWLKRQGIYTTLDYPRLEKLATGQDFFVGRWFYRLNALTRQAVSENVPGEEGGLLSGLLLGYKSDMSPDLRQDFTTVGLAHIIVVSGSNIAIGILLVNLGLARFFKRRTVIFLSLGILLFYVLLVGANPAVLRAGLMGAMAQIGLLVGREYSGLIGLATSAFLLTLWQPEILMDVGFQLSFMATLGLLILTDAWKTRKKGWGPFLKEALGTTLAAEAMILPLVIYYFHRVSLVSLLTNLLVLPVIPVIMALGGLTVVGGLLPGIGWLAQGVGGWCWLFLAYIISVVEIFAGLPFATLEIPLFHPVWIFVYYLVLGGLFWWFRLDDTNPVKRRLWQIAGNGVAVGGAFCGAAALWAVVIALWLA